MVTIFGGAAAPSKRHTRWLSCLAITICLLFNGACYQRSDVAPPPINLESDALLDGGTVENADRDKLEEYFQALARVESAEDEERVVSELAAWLKQNEYKLEVEHVNGEYVLSCPYFPPVTPWTAHIFRDIKNLDLLPQSEVSPGK